MLPLQFPLALTKRSLTAPFTIEDAAGNPLATVAQEEVGRALVDQANRAAKSREDLLDDELLVEQWAGDALQGLLAGCKVNANDNMPDVNPATAATTAFTFADAMLFAAKARRARA